MLAEGVADAATIDRVCRLGGGFRMGPFELIDLIGLDVNLSVARSFYEPGRRAGALAAEPDPGADGRGRPARAQERPWLLRYGDGPHREPDPDLGIEAPTLDPAELAKIDPAARRRSCPASSPRSPTRPPSRSKRRSARPPTWTPRCGSASTGRCGPLELTELIGAGPRRRPARAPAGEHGEAYRPPRACSPRRGRDMSTPRKPATEHTARRNREARAALPPDAEDFDGGDAAASSRPSTRPVVEDERRPRRLGPRLLRLPRRRAARDRPPQPLAPEPAEPDRRALRAGAGLLPAARLRPLEHARGRGRARASS